MMETTIGKMLQTVPTASVSTEPRRRYIQNSKEAPEPFSTWRICRPLSTRVCTEGSFHLQSWNFIMTMQNSIQKVSEIGYHSSKVSSFLIVHILISATYKVCLNDLKLSARAGKTRGGLKRTFSFFSCSSNNREDSKVKEILREKTMCSLFTV